MRSKTYVFFYRYSIDIDFGNIVHVFHIFSWQLGYILYLLLCIDFFGDTKFNLISLMLWIEITLEIFEMIYGWEIC